MPQTPPQTEQLARLVEGSRAQDEQLAQGIDALQQRWATIHDAWTQQAEAALVEGADASNPPDPAGKQLLIEQWERLLDRVAAGERALLGDEGNAGDAALRARARRLLNESLAKHIDSAKGAIQQAMLTNDVALKDEARRVLSATRSAVDQAIQETTLIHAREVHAARAEELGADRFIYLGPADSRNRPFCADKVGQVFTREEISNLRSQRELDVMTRCGGWGCRHHWRTMPYEAHEEEFRRMMGLHIRLAQSKEQFFTPDELKEIWSFDTRGWFQDEHPPRNIDRETITEEYVLEQARLGRQFLLDNARAKGVDLDADEDAPRAAAFLRDFVLGVADIEEPRLSVKKVFVSGDLRTSRNDILARYRRDIALLGRGTTLHPDAPDNMNQASGENTNRFIWGVHVDPNPLVLTTMREKHASKSALLIESEESRSSYNAKANTLFIVNADREQTSARARQSHETGHQIENLNLNAALAGQLFRDGRLNEWALRLNAGITNPEEQYRVDIQSLNLILEHQSSDEKAYVVYKRNSDGSVYINLMPKMFVHEYCSKKNPGIGGRAEEVSTEIISVGMEYLDNPWSALYFYKASPIHLGFMIALMQGKFGFREHK